MWKIYIRCTRHSFCHSFLAGYQFLHQVEVRMQTWIKKVVYQKNFKMINFTYLNYGNSMLTSRSVTKHHVITLLLPPFYCLWKNYRRSSIRFMKCYSSDNQLNILKSYWKKKKKILKVVRWQRFTNISRWQKYLMELWPFHCQLQLFLTRFFEPIFQAGHLRLL